MTDQTIPAVSDKSQPEMILLAFSSNARGAIIHRATQANRSKEDLFPVTMRPLLPDFSPDPKSHVTTIRDWSALCSFVDKAEKLHVRWGLSLMI